MIIPGRIALQRNVIPHLRSVAHQIQPCGIDLTLKRVLQWASSATIDFDNTHRRTAQTTELPFEIRNPPLTSTSKTSEGPQRTNASGSSDFVKLCKGSYLVEFNESVHMPLDLMGQILVRSSLFRSGALVHAGVMDSGYQGVVGAILQVVNPHGLQLMRDAKLAQIVFHQMSEPVEGYSGVYQGRTFV